MIVQELIEFLETRPPNMRVMKRDNYYDDYVDPSVRVVGVVEAGLHTRYAGESGELVVEID